MPRIWRHQDAFACSDWTLADGKTLRSTGFLGIFGDSETSLDVSRSMELGRLATEFPVSAPVFTGIKISRFSRMPPLLSLQMSAATGRCWTTAGFALPRTRVKTTICNAAGICRLHLVITRPHIHIHLVHYKLYGIIPYRLSVGAFQ